MDLVYGGGKYGLEAVKWLIKENRSFVVIDLDENCAVQRELHLKDFDGESGFLKGGIKEALDILLSKKPELIFPTAPIHLAAAIIKEFYEMKEWNEEINCILSGLPPKIILSVGRGSVVVSYNRDYTCIENCSAPDVCPVTKIRKPAPMYELVSFAIPNGYVIRSEYLKPGLGAIKGEQITKLVEIVKERDSIAVATACRCHGVITALKK